MTSTLFGETIGVVNTKSGTFFSHPLRKSEDDLYITISKR